MINKKIIKLALFLILLLNGFFLVYSNNNNFDIELVNINQNENYNYDIELKINNHEKKQEKYRIKILYEDTSLVVGRKTITCTNTCQDSIKLKRTLFGKHRIVVSPISSKGQVEKELFFDLVLEKEEYYSLSMRPVYYIKPGNNEAVIKGKIKTQIKDETQYTFEYFPLTQPSLRKESEVTCIGSCDFSFLLTAPFIIDKYQVNVYSLLGEKQSSFRLDVRKNRTKEIIHNSQDEKVNAKIKYKKDNVELTQIQAEGQLIDIEFNLENISNKNQKEKVKSIVVPDANLDETAIGFEYVDTNKAEEEFGSVVENSFAINPIVNPEVQSYNLTFVASSNALYKCKDYNFTTQNCFGNFVKVIDTIPGIEYTVTLTPEDPLFVEIPSQSFNVQHGTIESTATTFSDTISTIIPNETLVLFTSRTNDANPNDWQYTVNLTNSTTIEFSRYAGGGSLTNVSWQVISSNLFTVDRGVESIALSTNSVTIPIGRTINTSSSFGVAYGRCDSATTNNNHAGFFLIEILNSTHINLERGQGTLCAATVSWQVVEFEGANIQSNRISFTSTGTSVSDTITSVDSSESFLFFGTSASSGTDRGMETNLIYGEITSATNVQFTRDADVGTSNRDMFYYVIEHPQISVQRETFSSAADSTRTISSVNTSRSFHFSSTTNTGGGQTYSNNAHTFTFTDLTSLLFDKQTGSQTVTAAYEVIEFSPVFFNVSNQVNLTSSSGFDLTTDTLTCEYNLGSDANTVGISWIVDSVPLMVSYLPIEGGSSDALVDISGHSNNATCTNCPTFNSVGGFDGNGTFEFDGTNDVLNLGNNAIYDFTSNITLMAWVRMDGQSLDNDFPRVISKGQSTTSNGAYGLWVSDPDQSSIGCRFIDGGVARDATLTTGIENDNNYHHYACSYDGNIIRLYVDGNEAANNSVSFSIDVTTDNLEIGSGNTQRHFNGAIDEVRIYNRSLSAQQISAIYENRTNEILSEETLGGEEWMCVARPYSATQIGPEYFSNNVSISTDYEFLNLTQLTPINNVSVYQYQPFNVTINASCDGTLDCDPFNISLYYESTDSIGETGTLSTSGTTQNTITFQNTYSQTPIIVAIAGSNNNGDNNPFIPIIHGINSNEANISLCQDAGATTCSLSYTAEEIHYLVIDRDKAATYNWIDVGLVNATTNGGTTPFIFGQTFTNTPYLYSLPQTYNIGGTGIAAHNWFTSLTTTGANLIACDHPGTADTCAGTATEEFGYIAIDPVLLDFVKSNIGTQSISNSAWTPITYGQSYTSPVVLVGVNSEGGTQDPAYPWARSVTTTGADIRYCEVDGANDCDTHNAEDTRWISFEEGLIQVNNAGTVELQINNITDTVPFYIEGADTIYANLSVNESSLFNFRIIPTGDALNTYTLFARTTSGSSLNPFNVSILESGFDLILNEPVNNPFSVIQNSSFDLNVTLQCNGFCSGNFTATALYTSNLSIEGNPTEIENQALEINTTLDTPFYTNSLQSQTCTTEINGQCNFVWSINATGTNFSSHLVGVRVVSDTLGSNLTTFPRVTIIDRERIIINQTQINFSVLANYQGDSDTTDFSLYGSPHNNVTLSCISGDCSVFSNTFSDGTNYPLDGDYSFGVSCSATNAGNFSAIFEMVSNEDTIGDQINLSCVSTELQLYINLVDPDTTNTYNALYNSTFNLTLNVTCNQVGGCSNTIVSLAKQRERIGEVGRVSLSNYNEEQISFTQTYAQAPIVIATPSTNNQADNNALIPVVYDVTTSGFSLRLCQDAGSTTCTSTLSSESVDYMVFDRDKVSDYSWIDAGTVSALSNGGNTPITFSNTFGSTPFVFAQSQTDNDGGTAIAPTSWAHSITTSGAQLIACDHPGIADACAGSTTETFGYVAIDTSAVNLSLFDSGSNSISNSAWTGITFTENYTTPIIAVLQNDDAGAQDPQYPWARNVGFSGADIRYCEQDGTNDCDGHAAETVVWMSLEEGPIEVGTQIELVSTITGDTPIYSITTNPRNFNLTQNETLSVVFELNTTGSFEELFSLYGVLNNGIESQFLDIRIVYYLINLEIQKHINRTNNNIFNYTLDLNSFTEHGTPPNQEVVVYVFIPEDITLTNPFVFSSSSQYSTVQSSIVSNYSNINGTLYQLELTPDVAGTGVFANYLGILDETTSWQTNFTINNINNSNPLSKIIVGFDPREVKK